MDNVIGFSTGSVYKWADSINEQIDILKKIDCNTIEINYAFISFVDEELSDENKEYLRSLDYVSLHAPFFDDDGNYLFYENSEKILNLLRKLEKISYQINAGTVVFHPNLIKDYSIFKDINMPVSLENMPCKDNVSFEELSALLDKYPFFNLVVDTAHAFSHCEDFLPNLINKYKNRIQHVHLSDRRYSREKSKVCSHRQLLYSENLVKFEILKELTCPILLELSIMEKNYENLEHEYNHVKNFFLK